MRRESDLPRASMIMRERERNLWSSCSEGLGVRLLVFMFCDVLCMCLFSLNGCSVFAYESIKVLRTISFSTERENLSTVV